MRLEIPSTRNEFDGFAAFYESEIAPYLRAKENARRAAARNFLIVTGSAGVLALALAFFRPFGGGNFHAALFTGVIGAGVATWLLNRARSDIAHGLLDRVCRKIGCAYRRKLARPDYYGKFKSLDLLPNHNREAWEDEVRGAHSGADFVMCEAHLRYKSSGKNSSTRTVFRGQLFVIDYPKSFLGETVVKRDFGVFNLLARPGGNFSRVGLASPEFEKAFEAWSTDQVEARDLLDPVVLERFLELERLFDGKKLRAAFSGGKLLIALETGDRLNMGTMFKPLEDVGRVEAILKEFDLVFDLIDVAIARIDRPLDGALSVEDVRR